MQQRSALLIVAMQVGLFSGPDQPLKGQRVLDNINQLIRRARTAGMPVFAARHSGPQGSPIEQGSALWQLLPQLEVDVALDVVFDKTRPSCFFATSLRTCSKSCCAALIGAHALLKILIYSSKLRFLRCSSLR